MSFGSQASRDRASEVSSQVNLSHVRGICIELQSRADFLKSRPEFNSPNIIAISASQLSDCPHPGSEGDLPPAQFWVVSSQPSQDIVVLDSQPLATGSSISQQVGSTALPASFSQTTIPDSQESSNEFTQDAVEVPGTAEEFAQGQADVNSPKPSNKESSGSTIPSHQPNINQVSFAHELLVEEPDHQPLSIQESPQNLSNPFAPATSCTQALTRPTSSRNLFDGFLTQPEFDPGEFSLSAEPRSQSPSHEANTAAQQSGSVETPSQNQSFTESHQPAQRVSPLPSPESKFLTQTDVEFYSASEDLEVVPESSLRNSGQTRQLQEAALDDGGFP